KRLRRAAPFNSDLAKRSIRLNSATKIALTKLDIIFPEARGKTSFEELSDSAKDWITTKEEEIGRKFSFIGTGPADIEIIDREEN
ncbi:MAG: adenylosuccinate synthetase, partial [Candidatus Hodarchaeales archaeon]